MFSTYSPVFCCLSTRGPDVSHTSLRFLYIFDDPGLLCVVAKRWTQKTFGKLIQETDSDTIIVAVLFKPSTMVWKLFWKSILIFMHLNFHEMYHKYCMKYELRTPTESFFQKSQTFGLGKTNWAEIFWDIWGIFSETILPLWVPCPRENVLGCQGRK